MRCAVFPSTYRNTTAWCIMRAALYFRKCTRYFFQRDTSSESNCNRSFRGQPSGKTGCLLLSSTLYTLHSTPIGSHNIGFFIKRGNSLYPLSWGPLLIIYRNRCATVSTINKHSDNRCRRRE